MEEVEVVKQVRSDPGGSLPNFVANATVSKSPWKTLDGMRRMLAGDKYKGAIPEWLRSVRRRGRAARKGDDVLLGEPIKSFTKPVACIEEPINVVVVVALVTSPTPRRRPGTPAFPGVSCQLSGSPKFGLDIVASL